MPNLDVGTDCPNLSSHAYVASTSPTESFPTPSLQFSAASFAVGSTLQGEGLCQSFVGCSREKGEGRKKKSILGKLWLQTGLSSWEND